MIKILITEVSDSGISAILEKGKPQEGKHYMLEDATNGTLAQNRILHLLIDEWDSSGCCPWDSIDLEGIKNQIKLHYGEGFESFLYWDGSRIVKVTTEEEVPKIARDTKGLCFGKLKSWADYTLPQRRKCIKKTIDKMIETGVNSKRFNEICAEVTDR